MIVTIQTESGDAVNESAFHVRVCKVLTDRVLCYLKFIEKCTSFFVEAVRISRVILPIVPCCSVIVNRWSLCSRGRRVRISFSWRCLLPWCYPSQQLCGFKAELELLYSRHGTIDRADILLQVLTSLYDCEVSLNCVYAMVYCSNMAHGGARFSLVTRWCIAKPLKTYCLSSCKQVVENI